MEVLAIPYPVSTPTAIFIIKMTLDSLCGFGGKMIATINKHYIHFFHFLLLV
jgi:hypothetical protein